MTKKQFDITALQNDLERSSFFTPQHSPVEQPSDTPVVQEPKQEPAKSERINRTPERLNRTVAPNARTVAQEQSPSLLEEMTSVVKPERRATERYSFEIYSDQIPQIEELQFQYKKRTGQKLPASRILREALEAYLKIAFEAMKRKQ